MSETPFPSNFDELSDEDLAVLRAFDALDDLAFPGSLDDQPGIQSNSTGLSLTSGALNLENPEDMLILFASEADEDIGTIRRALQQVEQDNQVDRKSVV